MTSDNNNSLITDNNDEPAAKRVRTNSKKNDIKTSDLVDCLQLVRESLLSGTFASFNRNEAQKSDLVDCLKLVSFSLSDQTDNDGILPNSISSDFKSDTAENIGQMRTLFETHGFRTTIVSYPRAGLSIYKDSCVLIEQNQDTDCVGLGKKFLLSMLGLHPNQENMEHYFISFLRDIYCMVLFCNRISELISNHIFNEGMTIFSDAISLIKGELKNIVAAMRKKAEGTIASTLESGHSTICINDTISDQLNKFTSMLQLFLGNITMVDSRFRRTQIENECENIRIANSTYSNALLQLFIKSNKNICIKEIYLKPSNQPKNERITIFLFDPDVDTNISRPLSLTLMPSLCHIYKDGLLGVTNMMESLFWKNMLELGYFASNELRKEISPEIKKYFLSGLVTSKSMPILLNAHFTPTYPLSLYLFGEAGAGKSSFVSFFHFALNQTINYAIDPSLNVQFVKQNLNKPGDVLETEFELRPNNNDMSIMSIVQGRRMAFKQRKPGLVVIGLEEMPKFQHDADPNQLKLSQLLSQRFAGRVGNFKGKNKLPRNSDKRGISGDASLICIFTSNYKLEEPCADALKQLDMFSNMKEYQVKPISGVERSLFAQSYFSLICRKKYPLYVSQNSVELRIFVGEGDTRLLVQKLKILSYFIKTCISNTIKPPQKRNNFVISEDSKSQVISICYGDNTIELKSCPRSLYIPSFQLTFDDRVSSVMKEFRKVQRNFELYSQSSFIPLVLDMYFSRTLGPTVIVCQDESIIKNLFASIACEKTVYSIASIDPLLCKMTKSLYDKKDTPNLRDQILRFGKNSLVAVHLTCKNIDSQLCIREMIEDSPSMSAFSTSRSALHKTGILFCIYVKGCLTPEIKSRASLVIEKQTT